MIGLMIVMIVMIVMTFFPPLTTPPLVAVSSTALLHVTIVLPRRPHVSISKTSSHIELKTLDFFHGKRGDLQFSRGEGNLDSTNTFDWRADERSLKAPAGGSVFGGFHVPRRDGDTAPDTYFRWNLQKRSSRRRRSNRVIGRHIFMFEPVWFDSFNSDVAVLYIGAGIL
ncbi:MAG UNVERIFIED_CONTAM: hypothetical protein LVR18_49015 [Planctomycetaceae bacterium]